MSRDLKTGLVAETGRKLQWAEQSVPGSRVLGVWGRRQGQIIFAVYLGLSLHLVTYISQEDVWRRVEKLLQKE